MDDKPPTWTDVKATTTTTSKSAVKNINWNLPKFPNIKFGKRSKKNNETEDKFNTEDWVVIEDPTEDGAEKLEDFESTLHPDDSYNHQRNILASSASSAISRVIIQPLQFMKVKQQRWIITSRKYSITHSVRKFYAEKGFAVFWRGHRNAQFVGQFENIALFGTYEYLQNHVYSTPFANDLDLCNFTFGFIAGAMMVFSGHPLDKMTWRIRVKKRMERRNLHTPHWCYHDKGLRRYYRGVGYNLMYTCPLNGFKFMFYEMICMHLLQHTDLSDKDLMSSSKLIAAGALAGIISNFLVHPLDLMRARLEMSALERQHYRFDATCRRVLQCFTTVFQREGVRGLYKGLVLNMVRSAIFTAAQFSVFDKESDVPTQHRHMKNIFAGSVSSSFSRVIGQPLDVLKVRFQLQQVHHDHVAVEGTQICYRSIPHAVKLIYSEEGVAGLWRGHNVSQFQGFFQGITQFWTFEQIHDFFNSTPLSIYPRVCNFTSGFITGTLVVFVLSPIDMIRTRLMARSSVMNGKQVTLGSTAYEIFSTGGIRGFYIGCSTSLFHVGSLMGSKFMFYNIFCDLSMQITHKEHRFELPAAVLLTAGAASGFSSNIFTYPLDLIKRRLQMHAVDGHQNGDSVCREIVQCGRVVVQKEGAMGLYKGFLPCVIKSIVSTAVQFSSFDKLRQWIDNYL